MAVGDKFPVFNKIPRLNRGFVVTEKIDGTNGVIQVSGPLRDMVSPDMVDGFSKADGRITVIRGGREYELRAGSRNRWLTDSADNFGFFKWVLRNAVELSRLGEGLHYGEWYGQGIQRGYNLREKRFMLFNTDRWSDPEVRPACCEVATVLAEENSDLSGYVYDAVNSLKIFGSAHVSGWHNPEGVVVYHTAARQYFKVTLENDEAPKGQNGSK